MLFRNGKFVIWKLKSSFFVVKVRSVYLDVVFDFKLPVSEVELRYCFFPVESRKTFHIPLTSYGFFW